MDTHLNQSRNPHLYHIPILCTILQLIIHGLLSHSSSAQAQNMSLSCGSIPLQHPFGSDGLFPYKHMIQCDLNQNKLHLRTVSGQLEVQDVDYNSQTMLISDPSMSTCSSLHPITTHHYYSVDSLLPPTQNNTLLFFDCPLSVSLSAVCKENSSAYCEKVYRNCSAFGDLRSRVPGSRSTSAVVGCCATDFKTLGNRSLGELGCQYYTTEYGGELGHGIRLSFCLSDRIPDIRLCEECDKPDGNCGVGLRCICHPQQCENVVFSRATLQSPSYGTVVGGLLLLSMFTGFDLWNLLLQQGSVS